MKSYTAREVRNAVLLAVMATAIAMVALLDPSCRPAPNKLHQGPSRSILPP